MVPQVFHVVGVVLAVSLALTSTAASYNDDIGDFNTLLAVLNKPRVPDRFKERGVSQRQASEHNGKGTWLGADLLTSFSFEDCGAKPDPMHVSDITLSPDPLKISGNVTVGFKGSLSMDLQAPIQVELKVEKKVLFWIPIPCIDDIGSCTYADVCDLIKQIDCPPNFAKYGIPCTCPFKAGAYSLPSAVVSVNPVGIPSWLSDGDYKLTLTFKQQAKEIGCMHFEVSLTK